MANFPVLTIAFSGFFFVATTVRKPRSSTDRYMLGILILITVNPVSALILMQRATDYAAALALVTQGSLLLVAPLLILYTLAATDDNFAPTPIHLWLLGPFLLYAGLHAVPSTRDPLLAASIVLSSFVASTVFLGFVIAALALTMTRRRANSRRRITWLVGIHIGLVLGWMGSMIQDIAILLRNDAGFGEGYSDITPILVFALLLLLGLLGIRTDILRESARRRGRSVQSRDASELFSQIAQAMVDDELFLNPELSLLDLALHLNAAPDSVSAAITAAGNRGFRELVNSYRIDRFLSLTAQGAAAELTIEAVAFDAGFNSKSSFYRAFQQVTGSTPRAFMAQKAAANHARPLVSPSSPD